MNLNSTLTERDKKLLYMLVFIVIIFVFGWYIIRPLYKNTVADQESMVIASSLKAANETKVIGLSSAENLTEKFRSDLADSTSVYYDYMDSSEIDKLVTSYILRKGLRARDLTIGMPDGYVSEMPYIYSDLSASSEIYYVEESYDTGLETSESTDEKEDKIKSSAYYKDAVLGMLTGSQPEEITIVAAPMESYAAGVSSADTTESSGILCVKLSIVVEGDPATEQAMIDELTHNPSLRVTGFNWIKLDPVTYVLDDGSIVVVESELNQLQLSINLYMKDKTE
ncbi:MAG: hypothetical protein J5696_11020 [Lachnospiraceae bacterium]|nr:hypothetical protein [Lachnospiraceae bacterium]